MDSKTVFTKTAKGLKEATGKTSALSRDMRALLKEIDGKATVGDLQARIGKIPESKLQEALQILTNSSFIREFAPMVRPVAPSPQTSTEPDTDLDFTAATLSPTAKRAEKAARERAQAAAAVEAVTRAMAETEAKAKAEALGKARAVGAAEGAARATAEAEARAKVEAEARARKEAEERARVEAEFNARLEEARKAREEAERNARAEAERERNEAAEEARREADELRAKLEDERRAREEAERRAKAAAERERKEAEQKAQREADALRARLEEERKAREEAERKARAEAERERKEAEEKAQREADELRARLEEERKAREEAERQAKEEAEARARKEAEERERVEIELKARLEEERKAREEAERKARAEAERERKEAAEKAQREADELRARLEEERKARDEAERHAKAEAKRRAREDAERKAKEQAEREEKEEAEREAQERAERVARETEERARKEAEVAAAREADDTARKEAEDQSRREAEERLQWVAQQEREAEEHARLQAQARSAASLDELVRIETDFDAVLGVGGSATKEAANVPAAADDKRPQEAEARARSEAEERACDEVRESARSAAEAEAKRVEDERRRKDEEVREQEQVQKQKQPVDQTQGDVAASEREYAELKALLDAQREETERHFAEMEKEMEAEEAAAIVQMPPSKSGADASKRSEHEARERIRAEVATRARIAKAASEESAPTYRIPINWGKPVALGLFLILVIGLGLIHVVSFDGYIPQFEKQASTYLRQPVKIKALHLSMVPTPHFRLDGVSAGSEGQFAAETIKAFAELGSMFSEKKAFTSIELISPVLSEEALLALLFGKPQGQDFKVASISAKNGKLNSKTIILPTLDARISMGEDGVWQKIALETPDRKTSLLLEPKGEGAQLEVETNVFSTPFGPAFLLENFSAKGMMNRGQLRLSEFKGGIFGGYLTGSLNLKWGADWSLSGEVSARAIDPGRFAPALIEEGTLEGKAVYAMRAKSYDELFAAPRLEGSFTVRKGSLLGVDLARLLQGGGIGGKTVFAELSGNFVRDGGRIQLHQLRLSAGPLFASGSADADARKNIGGRFAVELKSPVAQARANLALTGTLREPRFSR